jgi:hypothetical protein
MRFKAGRLQRRWRGRIAQTVVVTVTVLSSGRRSFELTGTQDQPKPENCSRPTALSVMPTPLRVLATRFASWLLRAEDVGRTSAVRSLAVKNLAQGPWLVYT